MRKSVNKLVTNETATAEHPTMESINFTLNLKGVDVRHDILEGRPHLVVPVVMIVEGVLNGSQGKLFYPKEELAKFPAVWNYKPVVVYHPKKNGQSVIACDPDVINSRKVGVILNTKYVGNKLKAEAWLEENRLKIVDARVLEAVEAKEPMEVSTGLFTDNESAEGEFEGKKYTAIARNYRPDHLAILPDQIGACSVADGAGLLQNEKGETVTISPPEEHLLADFRATQNELSSADLNKKLSDLLLAKHLSSDGKFLSMGPWVVDVFAKFCIYDEKGKLFKQAYTKKGDDPALDGMPEEVKRVVQYESLSGKVINTSKEKNNMDKKQVVGGLIANTATPWEEADREHLMNMDEARLTKIQQQVVANATAMPKDLTPAEQKKWDEMDEPARVAFVAKQDKAEAVPAKNTTAQVLPVQVANKEPVTVEQYIANAPEGLRDVLESGLMTHNAEKQKLIQVITSNKLNRFTAEQLTDKKLGELQAIAVLAAPLPKPSVNQYMGLADAGAPATNAEEPLTAPVLDYSKSK